MRKILHLNAYQHSKIVYLVILWISIPIDVALGIGLYEWLKSLFGSIVSATLAILILSGILGAVLYLLHMWQMEYLTRHRK